jgi:hypothetical protein
MSKFFKSLKNDLLDRRLLPFVALVAVGLIAAIAYAAFAGSGSATAPTASVTPSTPAAGIAVSAVKSESESGAGETTGGATKSAGATRNPFTPLSEPNAKSAAPSTSATSGAAGSGSTASSGSESGAESSGGASGGSSSAGSEPESGSKSGTTTSGGKTPTPAPTPAPKKSTPKSQTGYATAVLLGTAAPGTPAPNAELTLYEGLKLQQPLPSAKQPLIVYRGVMEGGKSAAFTLVGELIPHGKAQCLPSATQCQTITVKPGDTEELEYVPIGSATVNYELYVVAIDRIKHADAASAKGASARPSTAGAALLRDDGVLQIPGLRFSAAKGALVLSTPRAFAARAQSAQRHTTPGR